MQAQEELSDDGRAQWGVMVRAEMLVLVLGMMDASMNCCLPLGYHWEREGIECSETLRVRKSEGRMRMDECGLGCGGLMEGGREVARKGRWTRQLKK